LLRHTIDSFIVQKSITICIYIYSHIEVARLYYIGLHYRILEEKTGVQLHSFFRRFFSFFFCTPSIHAFIVNLHSPGSNGRAIRRNESERERQSERREGKIKLQLTRMPATALLHSGFFIASSSHHIRFFVVILLASLHSTLTSLSCRLSFFCFGRHKVLLRPFPFASLLLYFFLLLLFCFALSATTRQRCRFYLDS